MMFVMHRFKLAAVAALLAVAMALPAAAQAPLVGVAVKAGPADRSGNVSHLDITLTVPEVTAAASAPLFSMTYAFSNVESAARTLTIQSATDSDGALTLTPLDAPNANGRTWSANRGVRGDLTVSYRVLIDNTPSALGTGPPLGLRTEGNGFSGAGSTFILTPLPQRQARASVRFDLEELGANATATTIFGDGDVELPAGSFGRLTQSFYMGGQVRRHPARLTPTGFSSVWLDPIPFDAPALMSWTQKLYDWYMAYFKADSTRPYRVFMRYNPINPGGGVALPNAFVVTHDGRATSPDELKITLAHEMLHTQIAGIAQWFSEGAATYYGRVLPLRARMITPAQFLENLNEYAARYYTNALIATPTAELQARFWEDTRIRTLPYDRGSFYLAVVDSRIRKASGGKRSLDDVVLALVSRNRSGQQNNESTWLELVAQEYGPASKTDYDAMLAGAVMLPDSDAYGPCFRRTTKQFRQFELGFDPKILAERGRIVRGVVEGSAAARAGLRDGDEIVVPVALDAVQGKQDRRITYLVRRNGRNLTITYLPRGAMAEAYQWERVPGVSDNSCS